MRREGGGRSDYRFHNPARVLIGGDSISSLSLQLQSSIEGRDDESETAKGYFSLGSVA